MAENNDAMSAWFFVIGQEAPSKLRRYPEERKEISGHGRSLHLFRVGVARQVTVARLVCSHCAEGAILGLPVSVIRPRNTAFGQMSPFLPDPYKLIGLAIRQRP